MGLLPLAFVFGGEGGRLRVLIEGEDVGLQLGCEPGEFFAGEFVHQICVGFVSQRVLTCPGFLPGIEVAVIQCQVVGLDEFQILLVVIPGVVDALHVESLCGSSGHFEVEGLQRADLGQDFDEDGQQARAEARSLVVGAKVAAVLAALEVIDEFFAGHAGVFLENLVLFHGEGDVGHVGNQSADRVAEAADGEVEIGEDVGEGKAVGLLEGAFEERPGDFKADEVMKGLGGESVAGYLNDVEPEFGTDVGGGVVGVGDDSTILRPELGEGFADSNVDGGMSGEIGGVVREGAEGEGVFVDVVGLSQHGRDEIAAADVMHQIREEMVAEGVVADVLDEAAAVGVGVGGANLIVRRVGIAGEEHGAKLGLPEEIDDLLVGENGVGLGAWAIEKEQSEDDGADEPSATAKAAREIQFGLTIWHPQGTFAARIPWAGGASRAALLRLAG